MFDRSRPPDATRAHRASVRAYAAVPLSDALLRDAVRVAQTAATSSHVQGYSLIRVRDAESRAALVELTGGQPYVAEAGAFLVVCADVRRHDLIAGQARREISHNLETFLLAVIDASLFAQNLAVEFESRGLGICYIGGLRTRSEDVDRLLEIPHGVWPLFGFCVGVPESVPARKPRLGVDAVLFDDRYPADDTLLASIHRFDQAMNGYYAARGLPGRDWSRGILRKFSRPLREHLADYYRSKGARLD